MIKTRLSRLVTAILVLTMLVSDAVMVLPGIEVRKAQAALPSLNAIVGFFRIGAAIGERNHIYKEAGTTAEEINEYYDRLIAQSQAIRKELIAKAARGEPVHFINSYVRIEAALEAERSAAIRMIETEKKEARKEFHRTLAKEITNILIASPGGQNIVAKVREGIGGMRETAVAVQIAANEGRPIEALGDALARKVGDIPIVQELARGLGSVVGHRIDRALGGAIGKLEKVIDNIQAGMGEAIEVLDQMDATVAPYDKRESKPVSLVENGSLIGNIFPVDRANPVVDVVASAFAGAAAKAGKLEPGKTRADMRDRIRGALLDEQISGIRNLASGTTAGQTYCTGAGRDEYEVAALQLGLILQAADDPVNTHYVVCYDIQTQMPVYAKMYGQTKTETEEVRPTVEGEEPTPTFTGGGGSFPAGTYKARGFFMNVKIILSETINDEVSISLGDDGTISGSVNLDMKQSYVIDGCIEEVEYRIVGTISGQVAETMPAYYSGPIEFAGTKSITVVESCGSANPEEGSVYQSGEISFTNGSYMSGQIPEIFYFEWKKP